MGHQVSWAWPCSSSGLLGTEPVCCTVGQACWVTHLWEGGDPAASQWVQHLGSSGAGLVWVSSHSHIFTNPTSRGKKNEMKIHSTLIPTAPGEVCLWPCGNLPNIGRLHPRQLRNFSSPKEKRAIPWLSSYLPSILWPCHLSWIHPLWILLGLSRVFSIGKPQHFGDRVLLNASGLWYTECVGWRGFRGQRVCPASMRTEFGFLAFFWEVGRGTEEAEKENSRACYSVTLTNQ